jgi:hypothetical protein
MKLNEQNKVIFLHLRSSPFLEEATAALTPARDPLSATVVIVFNASHSIRPSFNVERTGRPLVNLENSLKTC